MKNAVLNFSQSDSLKVISNVSFTYREIDVISCVLSGRTAKTIASFLSISPKTVENHVHNIMTKLECNSQESIRDFIEKSGKFPLVRGHYQNLLSQAVFKQQLKKIFESIHNRALVCCLHYRTEKRNTTPIIHGIEESLELSGVKVILDKREDERFIADLANESSRQANHVIYVVSEELIRKFHAGTETSQLIQKALQNPGFLTFLSLNETNIKCPQEFRDVGCVDFNKQESYFLSILKVLKRIVPDINIDTMTSESETQCESVHKRDPSEKEDSELTDARIDTPSTKNKIHWFVIFTLLSAVCLGFLFLRWGGVDSFNVQSDLIIPAESVLLKRPHLLTKIDKKFKEGPQGIQTVVLVGIGGAGKTTLARQYASSLKLPIVWEVNAETKEALIASFEHLAHAVSQSPEDMKDLDFIQKLLDSQERIRRVLLFVKKKLKAQNGWFLLFDNVETFSDIKDFYPLDTGAWGTGRILMTTRDGTIKNNNHINPQNVIDIEELNEKEKFTLLTDIIYENDTQNLSASQKERIEAFLQKIPPFPLDVSTAAYYIKDTKISYDDYIKRLNTSDIEFEKSQETLLKETSDYTKTRYHIMTLTLQNLIGENQGFRDLLLLISLLDSQDIPKDLLDSYKKSIVVEKFVRALRKQSLITTKASGTDQALSTFSIHRSTQEMCLSYLINHISPADYRQIIQQSATVLAACINDILIKSNGQKTRLLLKHGESFLERANILKNINKESSLNVIKLLGSMGDSYVHFGNFQRAIDLFYTGCQICKEHDNDDVKEIRMRSGLGGAYFGAGDYVRAKECYEKALLLYHNHHPGSKTAEPLNAMTIFPKSTQIKGFHPFHFLGRYCDKDITGVIWILMSLGSVYKGLGQFLEAKQLYENGLETYRNLSSDYGVGWTLVRLGGVYRDLGNHKQAKVLIEQGLVIHNKLYGENNTKNRWILAALGNAYRSLGDYNQAKALLEQSLVMYTEHYGERNIRTSWVSVHLGNTCGCLGYYEKAKDLLEKSLVAYKEDRDVNSSEISWICMHLGNVYRCLGEYKKSRDLLEWGLREYRKNFGNNHILTGWALIKVGKIYVCLGEYEKAKSSFEESFEIYKTRFGSDHINLAEIFLGLGQTYLLGNNMEKAEYCMNRSLKLLIENNHSEAYSALEALGDLNLSKATSEKNTEKSRDFKSQGIVHLKQALETVKAHFPEDSPHIVRIQSKLETVG